MQGRLAPPFPEGLQWLNVARPLSLERDLRGRFVLLDFWTYCCINCMHVLPELKRLEGEFPELVVVGVHSAKFYNEQAIENVRAAIVRYDIEHPVLLDENYKVWRLYDAHAWPTFVLISPMGRLLWRSSGEGVYDALMPRLTEWRAAYAAHLSALRIPLALEKQRLAEGLLSFPGKLAADAAGGRLFLTDSNHNRVIILRSDGTVLAVIGSGDEGWRDGCYQEAAFFRPQGIAYAPSEEALYVADTENHLIRRVDLIAGIVTTIAGTGSQARRLYREGLALETPLNSPWDVAWEHGRLWVAMAGFHQIWEMDLSQKRVRVWAGSGWENLQDGHRLVAALAQPSGLTLSPDGRLYFADSETSSIRYIAGDTVRTLVGQGLFEFGDQDGHLSQALLQHPIGLCWHENALWIADTYNHKIRCIDLVSKTIRTVLGAGLRGFRDGQALEALLNEPNDIKPFRGRFYIADTNNHMLRVWDPQTGRVHTLSLSPMEHLVRRKPPQRQSLSSDSLPLPPVRVASGAAMLRFCLPQMVSLTPDAPSWAVWQGEVLTVKIAADPIAEVALPSQGDGPLEVGLYVCERGAQGLCALWSYEIPILRAPDAPSQVEVILTPKTA